MKNFPYSVGKIARIIPRCSIALLGLLIAGEGRAAQTFPADQPYYAATLNPAYWGPQGVDAMTISSANAAFNGYTLSVSYWQDNISACQFAPTTNAIGTLTTNQVTCQSNYNLGSNSWVEAVEFITQPSASNGPYYFVAGVSGGWVVKCEFTPSTTGTSFVSNCSNILNTNNSAPVSGLQFDAVNNVLWVVDTHGHIYTSAVTFSSSGVPSFGTVQTNTTYTGPNLAGLHAQANAKLFSNPSTPSSTYLLVTGMATSSNGTYAGLSLVLCQYNSGAAPSCSSLPTNFVNNDNWANPAIGLNTVAIEPGPDNTLFLATGNSLWVCNQPTFSGTPATIAATAINCNMAYQQNPQSQIITSLSYTPIPFTKAQAKALRAEIKTQMEQFKANVVAMHLPSKVNNWFVKNVNSANKQTGTTVSSTTTTSSSSTSSTSSSSSTQILTKFANKAKQSLVFWGILAKLTDSANYQAAMTNLSNINQLIAQDTSVTWPNGALLVGAYDPSNVPSWAQGQASGIVFLYNPAQPTPILSDFYTYAFGQVVAVRADQAGHALVSWNDGQTTLINLPQNDFSTSLFGIVASGPNAPSYSNPASIVSPKAFQF